MKFSRGTLLSSDSLARGGEGTSGSCFIKNGNVAIFDKGKLSALIYGDEIKDDGYSMTGAVSKTNLKNTFRLREFLPGFCSFNYVRDGGATLNVVTVGDDAMVTDYGAECPEG
ncbi:hypothetical protein B5M10_23645 [Pluralibacter gergoviae]|uniref:hypothetical protein n=1 Tax=Pluralibacter gergoviae TaxID=61647 RepID=UPI0005EC6D83|nr:hypothetical protein [Pluralibacter gergoviae]KJM56111.1 hypothetical protein SS31_24625 [Pluralibacter gergoviae]OUQ92449.1 hypothetical protein B5M10_23645 [Pluralibacter gergoviae]